MKAIHIRNIEPHTLASLKRLAKVHHRSLQGELHAILERAVRLAPTEPGDPPLELVTVKTTNTSSWRREEIYGDRGR